MAANTIVSNIGKVNFFAVIPAGIIAGTAIYISILPISEKNSIQYIWGNLLVLVNSTPSIILSFFLAYILGSAIQVNSVKYTDILTPPRLFRKNKFPNAQIIQKNLSTLNSLSKVTGHNIDKTPKIESITKSDLTIAYNFWKDTLCIESPEAFDYYQSFEAQTRFYAGIYISSLISLICSIVIFIRCGFFSYFPGIILLILSILLIFTIGGQFYNVRKKEGDVLLLLYIAYLQKQN